MDCHFHWIRCSDYSFHLPSSCWSLRCTHDKGTLKYTLRPSEPCFLAKCNSSIPPPSSPTNEGQRLGLAQLSYQGTIIISQEHVNKLIEFWLCFMLWWASSMLFKPDWCSFVSNQINSNLFIWWLRFTYFFNLLSSYVVSCFVLLEEAHNGVKCTNNLLTHACEFILLVNEILKIQAFL